MADNHTKDVRSKNMSHIRSTNTKPEENVRKYLFSKGFRYRKNVKGLPGCPDIVLAKYKRLNGDGFELYCNTEESKRLIEESEQMLADEKENHKGSSDEAYENIIDESTDEIQKNENSDDISTKKTEKTEEE